MEHMITVESFNIVNIILLIICIILFSLYKNTKNSMKMFKELHRKEEIKFINLEKSIIENKKTETI